jgi:hypothetical protein
MHSNHNVAAERNQPRDNKVKRTVEVGVRTSAFIERQRTLYHTASNSHGINLPLKPAQSTMIAAKFNAKKPIGRTHTAVI